MGLVWFALLWIFLCGLFCFVFLKLPDCLIPDHYPADKTSGQADLHVYMTSQLYPILILQTTHPGCAMQAVNVFLLCVSWPLPHRQSLLLNISMSEIFLKKKARFQINVSAWDFEIILVLYYSESSEDFLFYSYKYRWLFSFFIKLGYFVSFWCLC